MSEGLGSFNNPSHNVRDVGGIGTANATIDTNINHQDQNSFGNMSPFIQEQQKIMQDIDQDFFKTTNQPP